MVLHSSRPPSEHGTGDEYWKIKCRDQYTKAQLQAELNQRKFRVPSPKTKRRLDEAASRMDRGMLSFDGCHPHELRSFCIQRGERTLAQVKTLRKPDLVKILEAADEGAQFPQFSDFLPELRVLVYTLYFESLPKVEEPTQPPISMVSRLTRTEAVPILYKECEFVLSRRNLRPPSLSGGLSHYDHFYKLRRENLRRIQKLLIEDYWTNTMWKEEMVRWRSGTVTFTDQFDREINKPDEVSKDLANYLEEMQKERGWSGLTIKNIYDLQVLMVKR